MRLLPASLCLLAFAAPAVAEFKATLFNGCSYDIFVKVVGPHGETAGMLMVPPNTNHQIQQQPEIWDQASNPMGISVKISNVNDPAGPVLQAEYSATTTDGGATTILTYDLSSLDGNPFLNEYRAIYPDTAPSGDCQNVICEPGSLDCDWAQIGSASQKTCIPNPGGLSIHLCS